MQEPLIRLEDVHFTYQADTEQATPALAGVTLDIQAGEYVAILGHNGSGKSTLARHLNALLLPTRGKVIVAGMDTRDPSHTLAVRRRVGMVFQEPDNQIVGTVVEEDVAFGPENLGVPREELIQRVHDALETVGLWEQRRRAPNLLSGGQKQRVAIAGVLAMQPACLVLDEATAMLDPASRADILATIRDLHARGTTIVAITHFMEEAVEAERVIVMSGGQIALEGTPEAVFSQTDRLRELHLALPAPARLAERVRERCVAMPANLLTVPALVEAVDALARREEVR
jgi:energy-coupling factor transporter ATPase